MAARHLSDFGEREQALAILRRIAHRRHGSKQSKVDAARELADLGLREPALAVLHHIAARPGDRVRGFVAQRDAARALAELGELPLARATLNDMINFANSDMQGPLAASELAEIGDRDDARRELTNIVLDSRATPHGRLEAARELSRRWDRATATALLNEAAWGAHNPCSQPAPCGH